MASITVPSKERPIMSMNLSPLLKRSSGVVLNGKIVFSPPQLTRLILIPRYRLNLVQLFLRFILTTAKENICVAMVEGNKNMAINEN